jgi:hypothetical protein
MGLLPIERASRCARLSPMSCRRRLRLRLFGFVRHAAARLPRIVVDPTQDYSYKTHDCVAIRKDPEDVVSALNFAVEVRPARRSSGSLNRKRLPPARHQQHDAQNPGSTTIRW